MVCERENSKLRYLASAVVADPARWRECLESLTRAPILPSPGLWDAIAAIRIALIPRSGTLLSVDAESRAIEFALRAATEELLDSESEHVRDAGRAFAWRIASRYGKLKAAR